ncbi:hypothetical protein [Streptococcus sp. 151470009-6]
MKQEIFVSLSEEGKTVSPLKVDTVLIFKHDWCLRQSIASFLFSIRSHRSQT